MTDEIPRPPGQPPTAAREWQLIEKLLMSAQDEQRRARRWGIAFRIAGFAYLFILLFLFLGRDTGTGGGMTTEHVALVEVNGVIAADADASADNIVGGLRDAFEATHSKAVIVRINSPGGSPVQAGIVYDEIRRLRAENPDKKLYAVIADVGASGGYYIAAAADEIYVDKASVVGSIGVIMQGFGAQELIHKLGIESRTMTSGENKNLLDPFAPVDPAQKQHVQQMLDTIHAQFIAAVKEGRGDRLKLEEHPELFSGLFWTGEQAVQLGLADGLGSSGRVARDVVGTEDIVNYSYQMSPFERLADRFGVSIGRGIASQLGVSAQQPALR
ncbi:MAG: signal peptide peptidase SppA [Gammaproteobacteria bacterium]